MEKNSFASRVVHMEKHEHGGSKEAADQEAKRSIHIDRRATKPFFELSRRRRRRFLLHFSFSRDFFLVFKGIRRWYLRPYLRPCYHVLRHPFGAADRAMLLN